MTQQTGPALCLHPLHHETHPSSAQPSAEGQLHQHQRSSWVDSPTCAGLFWWVRANLVITLQCWTFSYRTTLCFSHQDLLWACILLRESFLDCGCMLGYHLSQSLLLETFCSAEMSPRRKQNYTKAACSTEYKSKTHQQHRKHWWAMLMKKNPGLKCFYGLFILITIIVR